MMEGTLPFTTPDRTWPRLASSDLEKKQKNKMMENSFSHSNRFGKRRVGFALILAAFLGSCVMTELRAQVVVVPNSLATNDGNATGTSVSGPQVSALVADL